MKPGFDAENVLTMRMSLNGAQFEKSAAVDRLLQRRHRARARIPGVTMASASCCVPLEGGYGLPFLSWAGPSPMARFMAAEAGRPSRPDYFEVFKIPVLRGRTFTDRDVSGSTPAVVINQAMARRFWPKVRSAG